jgi:rSAM/selenodomain-associated transferase 2
MSIIIPVLNEAEIIQKTLTNIKSSVDVEILVIDGGSCDNTVGLVRQMGIKVFVSPSSGRANQMNFGASVAQGEILLFLHADTLLPKDYFTTARQILAQPETIAGAFFLKIDGKEKGLRLMEKLVNWRSQFFSLPYGDQAIFLKKTVFQKIGGFPDLPIMEDFQLMLNLRKLGKIRMAPSSVITSARRWQKLGIFRTTLINQLIIIGYFLKVSPTKLKRLYNLFPK